MEEEEIALKSKLVEATDAVRKKFNQIKAIKTQNVIDLNKFYEPISKPLNSLSNVVQQQQLQKTNEKKTAKKQSRSRSLSTSSPSSSELQQKLLKSPEVSSAQLLRTSTPVMQKLSPSFFETPSPSTTSSSSPSTYTRRNKSDVEGYFAGMRLIPSTYDNIYGIHYGKKPGNKTKTFIGNVEVRFRDGKVYLHKNNQIIAQFDGSTELYELLFLRNPPMLKNPQELDPNVLQIYKEILELTNAANQNYDENRGLMDTRWKKYVQIIKPLVTDGKIGQGMKRKNTSKKIELPLQKRLSSKKTEYIYWNKPRELVSRLRLLWSSKMAGHSGHDNEIMSIIEELREEGFIY